MTQYLKDLVKIDNHDELYDEIEIERVRFISCTKSFRDTFTYSKCIVF